MRRRKSRWVRDGPRQKQPPEFSKMLFVCIILINLAVTIYSCVLMWRTQDTSGLAYLIPAVYAELAAATGFYFNKAKAENQIKLKKVYGQLAEESEENANGY